MKEPLLLITATENREIWSALNPNKDIVKVSLCDGQIGTVEYGANQLNSINLNKNETCITLVVNEDRYDEKKWTSWIKTHNVLEDYNVYFAFHVPTSEPSGHRCSQINPSIFCITYYTIEETDKLGGPLIKLAQAVKESNPDSYGKVYEEVLKIFQGFTLEKWRENILSPLLPLHLSLQAFFGISRDEKGEWKNLPNDLPKEVKEKFDTLFSKENREKALLLVPEAKWDFYAEIGSRLGEHNPASKDEPYENGPILDLIEELFKNEKILNYEHFKNSKGKEINGKKLEEEIQEIIRGNNLRTVCAILANIDPKQGESQKISNEEKGKHRRMIIKSQNILRKHHPEYFKAKIHAKWPDLAKDPTGNTPHRSYKNLEDQLHKWNDSTDNESKAQKVIEDIENLASYFEQIVQFTEAEKILRD